MCLAKRRKNGWQIFWCTLTHGHRAPLSLHGDDVELRSFTRRFAPANDEVLRAISHFPQRAFGFVYLNPKHTDASLAELDRCVRDGPMVGVKLWVAKRCTAPELDPIVRRATELKAVVLQHTYVKATGNLPGESTPSDLAELARRHPEARFIGAHSGGDWEIGYRAMRDCPNIFPDLCGFDPTAGATEMAVRELGAERLLYGSDAGGRSFASQLAKVFRRGDS